MYPNETFSALIAAVRKRAHGRQGRVEAVTPPEHRRGQLLGNKQKAARKYSIKWSPFLERRGSFVAPLHTFIESNSRLVHSYILKFPNE
jgi:hypothetical protein